MIMLLLGACILTAALLIGFKLDLVLKAIEATGDHYYSAQRAFHAMEREHNLNAEAVKGMMAHFTLPPVTEPLPLPPVDEPTSAGKRKRKRG